MTATMSPDIVECPLVGGEGAKSMLVKNCSPRSRKIEEKCWAEGGEVRVGYHLLSTYCVPGKLQILSLFHQQEFF